MNFMQLLPTVINNFYKVLKFKQFIVKQKYGYNIKR